MQTSKLFLLYTVCSVFIMYTVYTVQTMYTEYTVFVWYLDMICTWSKYTWKFNTYI